MSVHRGGPSMRGCITQRTAMVHCTCNTMKVNYITLRLFLNKAVTEVIKSGVSFDLEVKCYSLHE